MTRQEALHELYTIFGYGFYNERVDEALNIAIKALEQEPKKDCISREYLKVLNEIKSEYVAECNDCGGCDCDDKRICFDFSAIQALNQAIEALEQEPKRGKWLDRASESDAVFRRHLFVCSECAHTANYFVGGSENWWDRKKPNYCPNCGARMEVEG